MRSVSIARRKLKKGKEASSTPTSLEVEEGGGGHLLFDKRELGPAPGKKKR